MEVFCFVHLSIQEHLAAVYVHLECVNNNKNILSTETESQSTAVKMSDVHKSAVDRALQSENGQFDLFLRFLLGLSLQSNQALLSGLLSNYCEKSSEETVTYIKEKIRNESSAERSINLFHCLNELNYNSLVEEIRNFLRSDRHSETELTPDQCSALAYVLLTSEDVMEEFDLKMCNTSSEGYRRLLPVVKTSRRAMQVFSTFLAGANLTDESCKTLASILKSSNSHVTELYLGFNNLGDFGVNLICDGLSDPHCKLEKLNLSHNKLRNIGMKMLCDSLTTSVLSTCSCLRELELRDNDLQDSGAKLLCVGLQDTQCNLQRLG
uniref:NACHT LRR and PYD domain-containing protein n=1 Tax=Astyanax mexicanus TaxID=7994 RepID=A0A3B1KEG9_ASTMX